MADTKHKIWLSTPHLGGNEMKYIKEAFDANQIAQFGSNVNAFEKSLADYCDTSHCAALVSGTAAIHLALIMLGAGTGDYVLCQSLTASSCAFLAQGLGAKPVLIDSEPETWNMDPELLEKAIISLMSESNSRLKAIIPAHLCGMPAKMDDILSIAIKYNIPVIEDAAEALGSRYNYRPAGSMGMLGILSFNINKIITTSGGGALLSDDMDLIEEVKSMCDDTGANDLNYKFKKTGFDSSMSNVLAGIGLGQMEVLCDHIDRRREINQYYRDSLADIPGVMFLTEPSAGVYSNYWLTTITIDPDLTGGVTRDDIRTALAEENIETRPLWTPLHCQPAFRNMRSFINGISESISAKGLCLPSGSNLSNQDLDRIISALRKSFTKGRSKLVPHKKKAA
jgi:dTDP-4-amino-4,6-dideoxygalactose transaminase